MGNNKMDKDSIFKLCSMSSPDEISKSYKTSQLIDMFHILYGDVCCRYNNKLDIAYKIWTFCSDESRTLDLCKSFL